MIYLYKVEGQPAMVITQEELFQMLNVPEEQQKKIEHRKFSLAAFKSGVCAFHSFEEADGFDNHIYQPQSRFVTEDNHDSR